MIREEKVWESLLSRDDTLIKEAFISLSSDEQTMVITHLKKIIQDEGWHFQQVTSAQTALHCLKQAGFFANRNEV